MAVQQYKQQPMGCDTQLANSDINKVTYKSIKLGRTDLVFGL